MFKKLRNESGGGDGLSWGTCFVSCHRGGRAVPAMTNSLDPDANYIRRSSVRRQNDIHVAATDEAARQSDVRLVETEEVWLRSGEKRLNRRPANGNGDGAERTTESEPGAKGYQKDLIRSNS